MNFPIVFLKLLLLIQFPRLMLPLLQIKPCSSTQTPTVSSVDTQALSSPLKARHSPTPVPQILQVIINNYTIPQEIYNISEDPVFIESRILPHCIAFA